MERQTKATEVGMQEIFEAPVTAQVAKKLIEQYYSPDSSQLNLANEQSSANQIQPAGLPLARDVQVEEQAAAAEPRRSDRDLTANNRIPEEQDGANREGQSSQ